MLSILIAARNEKYLKRTIEDILANAEKKIEIIIILDGWVPDPPFDTKDKRVRFYSYEKSVGQRACINEAARLAKGKYIMKLDAHCALDKGFDTKLIADCEYDWTVIPRMYVLDAETWTPKLRKRTDYMYIGCAQGKMLRAEYYRRPPKSTKLIDDTMCCMGPGWFMHKDRYWELGGMDEKHGGWGQMGVEVALKAWLSGGSLKVNKNTWFAHLHRQFPYSITGREVEKARNYSRDLWLNNKWEKQTRKFEWLLTKFNPPGWKEKEVTYSDEVKYYRHFTGKPHKFPKWMGIDVIKYPNDLITYQEIIFKNKPDIIIETGTQTGGSALFFAHMLDIIGKGKVVTVDIKDFNPPKHPRITYIIGRATTKDTLDQIEKIVKDKTCMVSLDSNHNRAHVKRELIKYGNFVTIGQYMVVEDTCLNRQKKITRHAEALKWFLKRTRRFVADPLEKKYKFSLNPGGWLRRVK